ncbi:DNA mismatch repair protein MutS [Pedobacter sp. P351]|uniref:MutS-related protein n=1 Tax=Pedobacter superstes TaxID=3133441 RepID=UPI0030969F0B
MTSIIINYYHQQISVSETEIKRYEKLVNTFSFLRLFSILIGGYIVYETLRYEIIWLTELVFLLIVVGFAFLVKHQGKYEKEKLFYNALKTVNLNEIASINHQENIYDDGSEFMNDAHNYSSDLDIFGKASLFSLLNRCASPMGKEMLAYWLNRAATRNDILQRQEAVQELRLKLDWVQKVKAMLLFARKTDVSDVNNLFAFFQQERDFTGSLLRKYIRVVPYIFILLAVAAWYIPFLLIPLILIVLSNAVLVLTNQLKVNRTDRLLSIAGKTLSSYSDAFKKIEDQKWNSTLCLSLHDELKSVKSVTFSAELKILSVLLGRLEYRLNMFIGPLLNGIMAWDVRQLIAIENWKATNRDLMPKAFNVLASFESLISLSSLHSNYPEYGFPEIAFDENYTYIAKEIGHPLIPVKSRVNNDFSLDNSHSVDIITGSNMAGKSTFLRTLGINAILAFTGAPVCAKSMRITVMNFFAYMRIRDSLNESISTFKAELNRLQLLLDVLKSDEKVYFLIDEMLRGTNSVDKYKGSKAVIEKLVSQNGVGIVATHDLQLAELENKYPDYIRNFYFDIQIVNGEMIFDYKLKHGECKTFNASLLLKQIGIDVEV